MIFIAGYPYVSERHKRVFDFFEKKKDVVLILPKKWKMKDGKVVIEPKVTNEEIETILTNTKFFHSKYPLIRGQLKGWMPALKKILKKKAHSGDILYSVSEPNLLLTFINGRIAKQLGLKYVFFTWQNVFYRERLSGLKLKFTEWLVRKNIELADAIICGNIKALDVLKPYLPKDFPILVSPISGLDSEKFKPGINFDLRSNFNLSNKKIVLFVGAIDLRKGIFKLIDAFMAARLDDSLLHLLIIGSGPLDDELKKYILKKGANECTTILPWVENKNLPRYFSNSDIFIYPSQRYGGWEEQFGYSIAEASSSGLPVISTKTGSIENLVLDGKTGILIDPEDTEKLSSVLLLLANDKDLRKKMGTAGREYIMNNFSHEIIAQKLENFLRRL